MLTDRMRQRDHSVSAIHGEIDPKQRELVMNDFRRGESRVLIATDVLSRGIDVQGVSLVVNYDLPWQKESYIHRVGRCGRFGRKGVAINFVNIHSDDPNKINEVEQYYQTVVHELPEDVAERMT